MTEARAVNEWMGGFSSKLDSGEKASIVNDKTKFKSFLTSLSLRI